MSRPMKQCEVTLMAIAGSCILCVIAAAVLLLSLAAYPGHASTSRCPGPRRVRIKWRWEQPFGDAWISGCAVTDEAGNVYVPVEDRCCCLSPDGDLIWDFRVPRSSFWRFILALLWHSRSWCSLPWNWQLPDSGAIFLADKMAMCSGVESMVVSGDGSVLIVSGNRIYALDSRGKRKWRYKDKQTWFWGDTLWQDEKTVYLCGSALVAVDADTGQVKWRRFSGVEDEHPIGSAVSPDGTWYLLEAAGGPEPQTSQSVVKAVNTDGTVLWERRLAGEPQPRLVMFDNLLCVVTRSGYVYALDVEGQLAWEYHLPDTGETTSYAVSADTLYIAGQDIPGPWDHELGRFSVEQHNHNVYALNSDGSVRWTTWLKGSVWGHFALDGEGSVYAQVSDAADRSMVPRGIVYRITPEGTADELLVKSDGTGACLALGAGGVLYTQLGWRGTLCALEEDDTDLTQPRVVERLTAELADDDWRKRWNAAARLGELGDVRAIRPLAVTLRDKDDDVKAAAAHALERLGEPAIGALIESLKIGDYFVREPVIDALAHIGQPAAPALVAALDTDDWDGRRGAVQTLAKMGEPGVPGLVIALGHDSPDVPDAAMFNIGCYHVTDERLVEPLIALLTDKWNHIRECAATALERQGDRRAVEPLIAALEDGDESVRSAAAQALGRLQDSRALEPLVAALEHADANVRREAAVPLGNLRDLRAVDPLIAALKDENSDVRERAALALRIVSQEDIGTDPGAWQKWWDEHKPGTP